MPLLNAFIDSIVCVGFNSERGLIIDRRSGENSFPLLSFLQPYVLAFLAADQAIYPEGNEKYIIDPSYPFISHTKSSSGSASNTKPPKKPTIPDAIKNIPLFCSPDGVKITHNPEDSRIHHIVFTQEEGKRSYAVVLTFQQKFIVKSEKPDADGTYPIDSVIINTTQSSKKMSKRIPTSYRRTTTIVNLSTSVPSSNSPNLVRKQYQNSTSDLSISGKSVPSFDTSEFMTSTLNSTSRMRSTSNASLSSNKFSRSNSSLAFDASEPFYLPHFLVLTSSHPYWTAMHEIISTIYNEIVQKEIEPSSDTYKILIQKYAFFACNTPIPPIAWERFSLSFTLTNDQLVVTFDPPVHTNRSVLDLDLSILLLTLNIGKLLEVLAAILTQQSIIFFSSDYSKLVTTLECLFYLIYPLKWIHIYIPIVPYSLRDYYLEGPPGSYIMGVHSRHESIVENLDLSFTCNLDNDKPIHVPSDTKFPRIPSTKLRRFIGPITQFVEKIKKERSFENLHTTISVRIDEQREYERRYRFKVNNKITEIFLDLMVDLCHDTLKAIYWKVDHQQSSSTNSLQQSSSVEKKTAIHNQTTFSKETYLLSKTEGVDREFYDMFIGSTAFQIFIDEERTSTTPTDFRKICQLQQLNQGQPYHFNTTLIDKQDKSGHSLFNTASTQMILSLPDWPSNVSTHYLDSCLEVFTYELEHAQEENLSPVISVYAYLRGCALLARGRLLEGLHDLYLIENSNLFPKDYIQTMIVPLLVDASLFDRFLQEPFYLESPVWKKIKNELELSRKFSNSSTDFLPLPPNVIEADLSLEQFDNYLHRLGILTDKEMTEILFKALLHWTNTTNKSSDAPKTRRKWSLGGNTPKETSNGQKIDLSLHSSLPAKLFELFLEIWQRTNAEKARMNSYLPKDRQKQESILMISSSDIISKNSGRGKLILTQRALYLLPEVHSSASLLTELLKIVFMDTYQHKTIFSSSKPAIRIYALRPISSPNSSTLQQDAEPLDMLLFKDNNEQHFWYKFITELWAGVSIAYAECDTTGLYKISRHIALMDTLANIDYNESNTDKKSNQTCIDMALNDLTIFTRMQKTGAFKTLTNETRTALHDRLSPSINESERHAVRCLIFTENFNNDYSLLWCAYGDKLKTFNTKTWICDLNDLSFPSLIICMCLDAFNKLWIGCVDGQLFLVDTIQRIDKRKLATIEGKGGCRTMAFDIKRNQMLIANRSGLLIIFNTINKQRVIDMNLDQIYKNISDMQQRIYKTEMLLNLRSANQEPSMTISSPIEPDENYSSTPNELKTIQIYENLLFACYRDDYILIFHIDDSNTYRYDQLISVKYKNYSIPINSFLVYNQQLWISASYIIHVFHINNTKSKNTFNLIMKKHIDDDHLLTMLGVSDYIWAGSSRGNVYIFRMDNYELLKTFDGHKDGVCCLCPMLDTYVISGSQQYDRSIVIWENIEPSDISKTRF